MPLLRKHMPELDVWRGTAITLVVFYHAIYFTQENQPGHIANLITSLTVFGWLGVNLFFVLSGFLITGILLDTKSKPDYFRNFYWRRAQRILPVYLLCILLLVAVRMVSVGGVFRALTFTANYNFIPAVTSYRPFWSLSVEEQFYLFWPLLVFVTNRRTLTALCVAICFLDPALRFFFMQHGNHVEGVHSWTPLVADSLALGALGALFFRSPFATKQNALILSAGLIALALGILGFGVPRGLLHRTNSFGAAFQVVPFDLFFAAAIFGSLALRLKIFSGRVTYPLRMLGDISYGLYLVHYIVLTLYDRLHPVASYRGHFTAELIRAAICMVASVGIAWLSRWYFEERFLRKKAPVPPQTTAIRDLALEENPSFSVTE